MATGKRAFEGKTAASAMAAVLERDPVPISSVLPIAPAGLDHVVQGCLEKDPEERWQSAGDVGRELRWIAAGGSGTGAAAMHATAQASRWRGIGLRHSGSGIARALVWSILRGHEPARTMRSFLPPPEQTNFDFTGDFSGPAVINSDGTQLRSVHVAKERGAIWVQNLDELAAKKLDGTEGAPFRSGRRTDGGLAFSATRA